MAYKEATLNMNGFVLTPHTIDKAVEILNAEGRVIILGVPRVELPHLFDNEERLRAWGRAQMGGQGGQ